ncbi:TPA: dATP/dGTP pyrophosphohydrolase domain-containing protein [Salmonella enterica subsp. enterica serovar Birkenhead]
MGKTELYTTPPASERERIRREHAEWSDATFGDVGPIGPLKHLSKEALETAAEPDDLSEWADMQFLLWDAQRRAGISDGEITAAMVKKLAINKTRQWPEPKDGEPRLHIKEQPEPVVPEEITSDGIIGMHECGFVEGWNACRAAMLQGAEPVSQTYELPELIEGMEVSIDVSTCDADAGNRYFGTVTEISELYTAKNGYILLVQDAKPNFDVNGNSPVIPDGWISCSERMPEDEQEVIVHNKLGYRYVSYFDEHSGLFFDMRGGNQMNCIEHILVTHWMPLPAAPEPDQN